MEGSSSPPLNPTDASESYLNNYDDVFESFASLELGMRDGTSRWSSSRNLNPHQDNIWAVPQGFPKNGIADHHVPENFIHWPSAKTSMDFFNGGLAPSSSINQFGGQFLNDPTYAYSQAESIWNQNQNFRLLAQNPLAYNQYQGTTGTGTGGFGFPYAQDSNNILHGSPSGLGNRNVANDGFILDNFVILATTPDGSRQLQEILQQPNHDCVSEILELVCLSVVELMTDDHGRHIFVKLIHACNDQQLAKIMKALEENQTRVTYAAFTWNGAYSIQRLAKKIKRTHHASTLPKILSNQLFELMIDRTGTLVIRQCLNYLGSHANQVIFVRAVEHYMELATHKHGCISLNVCIDYITGPFREKLLNLIADISDYLSNDPFGNYVVQHVVGLQNEGITTRICQRLKSQYVKLALKSGGSHVVEKCIKFSDHGMAWAVGEILLQKSALQLARDQFGNYVIQTAINRTKMNNTTLYHFLVMALEPHYEELKRSKPGRHVLQAITDEAEPGFMK